MHYIIKLQEEFVQCCDHISMLVYNIMMIFLFGLMEKKNGITHFYTLLKELIAHL